MKALGLGWTVQDAMYNNGDEVVKRAGSEAARRMPPVVTATRMGLPIGAGTDAHRVSTYSPFTVLQWLLDGRTASGAPVRGSQETPGRADALRYYTTGSAWVSHDEDTRGSLVVGKWADLAVLSAGAREVFLVEEPMAAAIGARLPVMEAVGNMIVDIGGGTTEVAVVSLGGVVTWKALFVAGDEMNRNIVQYAREQFGLLIGDRVAEEIKMKIGSAAPLGEPAVLPLRGRDLITGLPREVMVNDMQIRESLARSVKTIIENIKLTLETTPPELVADIYERGIVLAGGGALLHGLDSAIAKEIQIPVRIADDPLTCVVRGCGALLDQEALLEQLALPLATEEQPAYLMR